MKKVLLFLIFFLFAFPRTCWGAVSDYTIQNFDSQIEVNQDTSLTVTETIQTYFNVPKHGIFRVIPVIYSAGGKGVRANFQLLSVTDEDNKPYQYTKEGYRQSMRIKIGDPNRTITGLHTYVIKYKIGRVLLRYQDHDEVYWNVTGSEWDTTIDKATARVNSPFAKITKAVCYAGQIKTQEKYCQLEYSDQKASFETTTPLSWGKDFTLVVALNKENQLHFPGLTQKIANTVADNWGYSLALMPLVFLFLAWYKKGRDIRFLSDNVYTRPEDIKTRTVSLFEREHLPLVYSPIQGLTPAQVGTIIDGKVDTKDVVAEIVELARLGFIEIQKTEKKKFLGKETDYLFVNKKKDSSSLKSYQKLLLDKLFEKEDSTYLSKLKNHFYQHLAKIKADLYENLGKEGIFEGNPEKVTVLWLGISILFFIVGLFGTFFFSRLTFNNGPTFLLLLSIFPAIFLVKAMPRRTAWGHSLYRQITGLKFYLNAGKWREEIAEKNLFFEEILPLAISLGVVHKLASDMAALGIEPPEYLNGFTAAYLVSDLDHFSSSAATNIASSLSGRSSWSGGSGFSGGGGGGGGFGGGGGGSW